MVELKGNVISDKACMFYPNKYYNYNYSKYYMIKVYLRIEVLVTKSLTPLALTNDVPCSWTAGCS